MKKRFTILMAACIMLLTILTYPITGWSQAKPTTYKLTAVTSVSAGNKYVFVNSSHAVTTVDSKKLQSTSSYNTTGLAGTESYVWTLETATGGVYMKMSNGKYLNNSSGSDLSNGNTGSSIWSITFSNGIALISNTSNNNRFLGDTGGATPAYTYKAYATSNLSTYPHDFTVYILEEESTTPSISVSPTSQNVTCTAGSTEFTITPSNINNPSYTLQFYTAASGGTTTDKPDWINTPSFSGNTLTLSYSANTGSERSAYFTVKSGDVESGSRVTLTQAQYTVTPPTLTDEAHFDANMDVTITPASGTTVYYTTDGTTPSNSHGTSITEAATINIKATTTVKAIGYDNNSIASTVTSETYTKDTDNISDITSTGSYSVVGTIVAAHSRGFIFGDGTGYTYYYKNNTTGTIGNIVKFSNKTISTYGNVFEFNDQTYSGNQPKSNYDSSTATATPITGSDISGYSTGSHLSDYVEIEGVLSTYNFSIENYTDGGMISYPTDGQKDLLDPLDGHKVKIKGYFTGFSSSKFTLMLESVEDINPVVTASVTELTGFTYNYNNGPSAVQSFSVSGSHLTANLVVTASSNYEVCLTENGDYASNVSVTPTSGTVSTTTVYARLKAGLSSAAYASSDDKITVSSGAASQTIALSGTVTHAITKGTPSNGTLTVASAAYNGETVTITAAPNSGYKLDSWSITKTSDGSSAGVTPTISSGNDYTVTMPDFAITVNATFVPAYDITVTNSTPSGGNVTTTPTSASAGTTINITVTPNAGYVLNSMVVKDANNNDISVTNNQFTMPESNVTITVSFIATYTVTYYANGVGVTGDVPEDDNSPYISGSEVTVLSADGLSYTGHTFKIWNTQANGSGADRVVGSKFNITANTELYAQWTTNTYDYTLTVTGQDADALASLYVNNSELDEDDKIAYGVEVTVVVVLSDEDAYDYAIKVKNTDTGEDVTVSNDKFTMPAGNVAVTVFTDAVAKLTSANMSNMTNAGTGYGTDADKLKYITLNGFYWEANAYQTSNQKNYLQINTTSNQSYIKLPVFPGKIESIYFGVTNGSGGNATTTLYFNNTISTLSVIASSENISSKNRTIDLTSVCYNTGYILSNGATRVTNIVVTYRPYQDMTGSTITSVDNDVMISIPGNAAVTATNLTIPASSSLCIKSGAKLTMSGTLTNSGNENNLIIEDGGQLICNNSVAATVKKSITASTASKGEGWYTISSPVNNKTAGGKNYETVAGVTNLAVGTPNKYDLYRFNETKNDVGTALRWENYKVHNYDLEMGRGYIYRKDNTDALSFVGNTNVGDITYTLTCSDVPELAGFNLIGNPYPHSIAKGSGKAIYHTNLATNYYVLSNDDTWALCTDGDEIPAKQGILVKAVDEIDLTISDTPYAPAAPGKYKNDNIRFSVKNEQFEDVAYAWFDKGYGLNKIAHRNPDAPMLYIPQDGTNYATAIMSDDIKVFGLSFKAMTMSRYTLRAKANGDYTYLHVIDRLTGEDVDMLLEGEYSFIASPNDNENRFIVKLEYKPDYSEGNSDIFAYQSGSEILVSGEGELQIFDVTGRNVMTTTINGAEAINGLSNGVYVFRLVGNDIKTQKIVVR